MSKCAAVFWNDLETVNLFSDEAFYILGVGINRGDIVPPISTPEVYIEEAVCVKVELGCVFCHPTREYTVQVNEQIISHRSLLTGAACKCYIQVFVFYRCC